MEHEYGLDWIDQDELFRVTEHTFENVIHDSKSHAKGNPPDPFTLMAQAAIGGSSVENILSFEIQRRINKSLSNSVGLWHQHVLGLADGWEDLGSNGGGVDLRTVEGYRDARFGKPIFAEVKNRFNTIKASDEKNLWDTLDLTAKTNNAVSYVFQIVPKTVERYDREWRVSGRPEKGTVRCCDGATAYEMVFNRKNALYELYEAFPCILADVLGDDSPIDPDRVKDLYYGSFPQ